LDKNKNGNFSFPEDELNTAFRRIPNNYKEIGIIPYILLV